MSSLTTRTAEYSCLIKSPPPQWTNRGDGFFVQFKPHEELPLKWEKYISSGHSAIYQSHCTETGETVVIKQMLTHGNPQLNSDLNREVEVLRPLKHYHCIRALGSFTRRDEYGIVMQPSAPCDLNVFLSQPQSYAAQEVTKDCELSRRVLLPRIMGCLAHALQYIHGVPSAQHKNDSDKMIRHRDITPSNILLDGSRIIVTDFGISKFYTATQTGTTGTSTKTLMVKRSQQYSFYSYADQDPVHIT